MSHDISKRSCVYVSIPMRYDVTDKAARKSFIAQASQNYVLGSCEVPIKDIKKFNLGRCGSQEWKDGIIS